MTIVSSCPDAGPFALSLTVSANHPRDTLATDVVQAIAAASTSDGSDTVQVWIEEVRDGDDELIAPTVHPYRDLLELRRALPAPPSGLRTRGFRPDQDLEEFITVNNRAFSWHPEQSGLTLERLQATMKEPWFDAEGFRILELEDRMAGFCWTKLHDHETPRLGEIYVIAVDPDFHGRGLGGPMTLAGLEWLASRGVTMSNLYVEADNVPALHTYDRLGFVRHSTNRAYTSAAQ